MKVNASASSATDPRFNPAMCYDVTQIKAASFYLVSMRVPIMKLRYATDRSIEQIFSQKLQCGLF